MLMSRDKLIRSSAHNSMHMKYKIVKLAWKPVLHNKTIILSCNYQNFFKYKITIVNV